MSNKSFEVEDTHLKLKSLVFDGLKTKNIYPSNTVLDRVNNELSIIENLGFNEYFIFFNKIIEACNELHILRSFGRGSATGSIVNFCLDITKINPISEGLLFEKFLHPKQKNLPDIDIEVPNGSKEIILEKLKLKHPEYNSYFIAFLDENVSYHQEIVLNSTIYKKHRSGVIITKNKLSNSIINHNNQDYYLSLDYLKDPIYINKFDILELEYLNRLQLIADELDDQFHPYKLYLKDNTIFKHIATESLENIFQLNNPSFKFFIDKFKPNSINELTLINAMFRPGLINYFQIAINHKLNGIEPFCTSDNRVSEILKDSFGLLIYQETFSILLKEIAGISIPESEIWRRKIKKDIDLISFKNYFHKGCKQNSTLTESEIESLTKLLLEMRKILFQKSHALSCSILAYWGVYYKVYFSNQFEKVFKSKTGFLPFELY